jgi:hypothetical protein
LLFQIQGKRWKIIPQLIVEEQPKLVPASRPMEEEL